MTRPNPYVTQLNDPDSDMVKDALTRRCIVCHAKPSTEPNCTDIYGVSPLKGRLVHFARTTA
jgi:uncharacterized membrane protein